MQEWSGQTDGRLLVKAPQPYGDILYWMRYLPVLSEMGVDWKIVSNSSINSILDRLFPGRLIESSGEDFDYWIPLQWLDGVLKRQAAHVPIFATSAATQKYSFLRTKAPCIGMCYEAGDKQRSFLNLSDVSRIFKSVSNVSWVNLQYQKNCPSPALNVDFQTWEDTAAIISNLDAVVSVDTAVAHLAGGMGKPLFVLNSPASTTVTRYREFDVFYPHAKVFRPIYQHFGRCVSILSTADQFINYATISQTNFFRTNG